MSRLVLTLHDTYKGPLGEHDIMLRLPAEVGKHLYSDAEITDCSGESVYLDNIRSGSLLMRAFEIKEVSDDSVVFVLERDFTDSGEPEEKTVTIGGRLDFCRHEEWCESVLGDGGYDCLTDYELSVELSAE